MCKRHPRKNSCEAQRQRLGAGAVPTMTIWHLRQRRKRKEDGECPGLRANLTKSELVQGWMPEERPPVMTGLDCVTSIAHCAQSAAAWYELSLKRRLQQTPRSLAGGCQPVCPSHWCLWGRDLNGTHFEVLFGMKHTSTRTYVSTQTHIRTVTSCKRVRGSWSYKSLHLCKEGNQRFYRSLMNSSYWFWMDPNSWIQNTAEDERSKRSGLVLG